MTNKFIADKLVARTRLITCAYSGMARASSTFHRPSGRGSPIRITDVTRTRCTFCQRLSSSFWEISLCIRTHRTHRTISDYMQLELTHVFTLSDCSPDKTFAKRWCMKSNGKKWIRSNHLQSTIHDSHARPNRLWLHALTWPPPPPSPSPSNLFQFRVRVAFDGWPTRVRVCTRANHVILLKSSNRLPEILARYSAIFFLLISFFFSNRYARLSVSTETEHYFPH